MRNRASCGSTGLSLLSRSLVAGNHPSSHHSLGASGLPSPDRCLGELPSCSRTLEEIQASSGSGLWRCRLCLAAGGGCLDLDLVLEAAAATRLTGVDDSAGVSTE